MSAATRRAALGAILSAPLTGGAVMALPSETPQPTTPAASPKLVRLIAKHDRIERLLRDASEEGAHRGLVRAAGAMWARVAGFQSASFADTLAKAACLARMWPLADAEAEVRRDAGSGYAYMDCMALNIAVEVMRLGEGSQCA
jgi:hypothetical protein